MPNLPPGTDQSVNPAVTPTWVFTPPANGTPTLRLYNTGHSVVWAGGANVSQFNGFPVPPGSKPVELQNVQFTVYTCSNVSVGSTGYTTSSSAMTVGSTVLTTSASVSTIAAGQVLVLGTAPGQEVVTVTATGGSTTTTFTLATATLYDHVASSPVTAATMQPGQVRVTAGVV